MPCQFTDSPSVMRRALELAARGIGLVEPNPAVGAVVVDDDLRLLGEGYHQNYGGPHAEVHALRQAGDRAVGATLFVTLEPCSHHGKTPPCADAVIGSGITKVVVAMQDPAPHVDGDGIRQLKAAGIDVSVGLLESEARRLNAPFIKRVTSGQPYVHVKWAMTLDGKIASRIGVSKWISNGKSRRIVHTLRGRMDGILVGANTALTDDPLLTARPAGPRVATRIVLDTQARLPIDSQLVRTLDKAPVLVVCGPGAMSQDVDRLTAAGIEVVRLPGTQAENRTGGDPQRVDLVALLAELGRREMTNILVEGGGQVAGAFFDQGLIDEVHAFVAPKLVGGATAIAPMAGTGLDDIPYGSQLDPVEIKIVEGDVYIRGTLKSVVSCQ